MPSRESETPPVGAPSNLSDVTRARQTIAGRDIPPPLTWEDAPAMEPTREFAGAFRDLVASTGLPLDRLADRVGRSATTLSRYQNGQGRPDHTVLAAVFREARPNPGTARDDSVS